MNSRNECVRKTYTKCCSWGERTRLESKDYQGGPVPMLINPYQKHFRRLTVFNVVLTVLVLINIAVQAISAQTRRINITNNQKEELKEQLESQGLEQELIDNELDKVTLGWPCPRLTAIYCIVALFNFINTLYLTWLTSMKYASDQQWARTRTLSFVLIVIQLLVSGGCTYFLLMLWFDVKKSEGQTEVVTELEDSGLESNRLLQDGELTPDEEANEVVEQANDDLQCVPTYIILGLVQIALFVISLLANINSLVLLRLALVTRIKRYAYYKREPDIAIKY